MLIHIWILEFYCKSQICITQRDMNLKIKWYSINLDSYIHILHSYRYMVSKYYLPFTIYPSDSTSLQRSRRVAWYITCVRSYVNMNRTFSGILWKCNIEALDWRWQPRSIWSNLHRKRQWPSVTPRSPSGWVRQLQLVLTQLYASCSAHQWRHALVYVASYDEPFRNVICTIHESVDDP